MSKLISYHRNEPKKRNFAIFTIDIRRFSSLASVNNIQDISYFISQYITLVSLTRKKIEPKGKVVLDNFLGDGFLIFFEDTVEAVIMALRLRNEFKAMVKELTGKLQDLEKIGIGIGIHSGGVYYGTFGYGELHYTTGIGHDVNMAFRLVQAANKWEILISEDAWPDVNRKTVNTCRDKFFPKGGINAIWPYSILRLSDDRERKCCTNCKEYKFCNFNWVLGSENRDIDPFYLVPENIMDSSKVKYRFTKKMLCAYPTKKVVPDEIPSIKEGICGGCDPNWKIKLPENMRNEAIKHCKINILRGYHGINDRECCDDCTRYNTCLFNLHRGKNQQSMACCEKCEYFFEQLCPGEITIRQAVLKRG